MAERFVCTLNLDAGQRPIADLYEARDKRRLKRINAAQAHDQVRNALSRALRWDAQAKMGMPMDHYPRRVRVTVIVESVEDPKASISFEEAAAVT